MCPFCRAGFLPEEAASLDERTEPADRPNGTGTSTAVKWPPIKGGLPTKSRRE
jgi:hypothetical protein